MPTHAKPASIQYRDGSRYEARVIGDVPVVIGGRHGDVRVPGATVSKRHARIFRAEDRVWIEDLGGDGVWVNGTKVECAPLANRDKVQVGALEIEFWEG